MSWFSWFFIFFDYNDDVLEKSSKQNATQSNKHIEGEVLERTDGFKG